MKKPLLTGALIMQLCLGTAAQEPAPSKPSPSPSPSSSQKPTTPDDDDVVRITTNLVQVDAVVTDKNGKPVTDLRPEEVEIHENGKPQKITSFSYVSLDSGAPAESSALVKPTASTSSVPPVKLRPEQVRRTMALLVDDLGLSLESVHFVRAALKKFVDQNLQPNDLVAIVRSTGGVGALQQFTSDKRLLYAAIDSLKWYPRGRGKRSTFDPIEGVPAAPIRGGPPVLKDDDPSGTLKEDLEQFRIDRITNGTLGAINYVVHGLKELPGRKSIVLITDGFPICGPGDPTTCEEMTAQMRAITDMANRSSVMIYTMDARGLETLGFTAADKTSGMTPVDIERVARGRRNEFNEMQDGPDFLARKTGGIPMRNTNDLAGGIKKVVEDQKGYYLIGYRPDEATFDKSKGRRKFHDLGLKVTRAGKFNIRMRSGFYGITDEERVPVQVTPISQMTAALNSPFGASGVHVRLTSLFANDPKQGSFMRSMLHIRGSDLTFTPEPDGWHKAVFHIAVVTFGDTSQVVDQVSRQHTVRLKGQTYERVMKAGLTYNVTVPIKKAGGYQLRTVLRDVASGRIGSASQFIEVPDIKKNRLAISGILASGMSTEAYQRSLSTGPSQLSGEGVVEEPDSNAGAAVRKFRSGTVLVYGLIVYNAQLEKVTGKPQIQTQVRLFRDGQQVYAGRAITVDLAGQPDLGRLATTGAIQLGTDLHPGEYQLQVIATDPLAKGKYRMASQWLDFEIVK